MTINISYDADLKLYTLTATDDQGREAAMECLSETDLNRLSIREIMHLMEQSL